MKEEQKTTIVMDDDRSRRTIGFFFVMGFIFLCMLYAKCAHAQSSPAEEYYNSQISSQTPSSELPSDAYYNSYLRSGPPTGPGGSGEGDNEGTGTQPTPVGDALLPLLAAAMVYSLVRAYRTQSKTVENQKVKP